MRCDVWKAGGVPPFFARIRRPWDGWVLSAGSGGPGAHTITQHPQPHPQGDRHTEPRDVIGALGGSIWEAPQAARGPCGRRGTTAGRVWRAVPSGLAQTQTHAHTGTLVPRARGSPQRPPPQPCSRYLRGGRGCLWSRFLGAQPPGPRLQRLPQGATVPRKGRWCHCLPGHCTTGPSDHVVGGARWVGGGRRGRGGGTL